MGVPGRARPPMPRGGGRPPRSCCRGAGSREEPLVQGLKGDSGLRDGAHPWERWSARGGTALLRMQKSPMHRSCQSQAATGNAGDGSNTATGREKHTHRPTPLHAAVYPHDEKGKRYSSPAGRLSAGSVRGKGEKIWTLAEAVTVRWRQDFLQCLWEFDPFHSLTPAPRQPETGRWHHPRAPEPQAQV